ncbi:hypothetical protein Tco_1013483 [Tanacetum coccineum]
MRGCGWVVTRLRPPEGERKIRGGAWYNGSSRSGEEEHLWCWPENSPENFSGGGWPEKVAAGGVCRMEREREVGEDEDDVCVFICIKMEMK